MSERTRCNFCSLQNLQQQAEQKGRKVTVGPASGDMHGWLEVTSTTKKGTEPETECYFMELSNHCVC